MFFTFSGYIVGFYRGFTSLENITWVTPFSDALNSITPSGVSI
ncbi:hypothetical protein PALI_a1862 [Pseudoalteromonas aliena SW19]|uniref:Uncharacterized protein n=1 Tax=Pseudoalteromonas aliena SW19 TaxID=1314866 RepID=A0ABR9DY24_9GAMM|nr:hypothetical protein [Pseudoalteromonas aliena SW19]